MFALERLKIIKTLIVDKEQVEVNALSQMLNVSEVTIRRDLEKLEQTGFLLRTHGGAVLSDKHDATIFEAQQNNVLEFDEIECDEIATIACHMIHDDDTIMLTNGPINMAISKKILNKRNVTVLTNDINIAISLTKSLTLKVILLGGNLDFNQKAVFGTLTNTNIREFFVNKIFIEIEGLTDKMDFTSATLEKANLIQEAMANASEKIIVCKSSAFGKASFYKVGSMNIADKIVTTSKISDESKTFIFDQKIKLYTAVNLLEGSV